MINEMQQGDPKEMQEEHKHPETSLIKYAKHFYNTYRFGELGVHFVMDNIQKDNLKFRSAHDLQTYTLSTPFMTPLRIYKSYVTVPRMAILPYNWDKIKNQPIDGDDVDTSLVGTSVPSREWNDFLIAVVQVLNTYLAADWNTTSLDTNAKAYNRLCKLIRSLNLVEMLFSFGSLAANLKASFGRLLTFAETENFDQYFDHFYNTCGIGSITIQNVNDSSEEYEVLFPGTDRKDLLPSMNPYLSFHEFLGKVRDGFLFIIIKVQDQSGVVLDNAGLISLLTTNGVVGTGVELLNYTDYTKPFDLARFFAYQMSVAEFATNEMVDYIYSSELYRQLISSYIAGYSNYGVSFQWNGLNVLYDILSSFYFIQMTSDYDETYVNDDSVYSYLCAIFTFRRSLKYLDYFTGSRTRPLAVGDVHVPVESGNTVNVVDIVKYTQSTRLANVLTKIGRKLESVAEGLFGQKMKPDFHNPLWLGKTEDYVGNTQVENTGADQLRVNQSVTSRFVSNSERFQFEADFDRDCITIGFTYFDIERSYFKGVDRSFMHEDRYDFFNPYMQYCGDQEVYGEEYDSSHANILGYQGSYEEYKQDVNRAAGGFVTSLKGYTFLDNANDLDIFGNVGSRPAVVSPDFIRSKPSELDSYYTDLTGHSLATYFHFIVDTTNIIECNRPIAYNPQMLG